MNSLKFYLDTRWADVGFLRGEQPYQFNRLEKIGNFLLTPLEKSIKKFEECSGALKKIAYGIIAVYAGIIGIGGYIFKRAGEYLNPDAVIRRKYLSLEKNVACEFELDSIYKDGYKYSLPRKDLESYLSGNSFDYKKNYTDEEAKKIRLDIHDIVSSVFLSNPIKEKVAIITAGGPGVGKTTVLRKDLLVSSSCGKEYSYIDPDDVCLKRQQRTFLTDVEKSDSSVESRRKLYDKWRPASNAITHLVLANLIKNGYGLCFGTTASGPATKFFFDFLKKQGYKIKLLHVSAPADVCWESIKERDKTFVQTTETDVREKAKLVPQRINDTYLKYADEIEFYYRGGVNEAAKLAASWTASKDQPVKNELIISNQSAYDKIKQLHKIAGGDKPEFDWEKSIEDTSDVINFDYSNK